MNLSVKQYGWFFCAFIALILSSWHFSKTSTGEKLDEQALSRMPDMFINALTVHRFDETGKLIHQLQSPFVQHFPKDDSHYLTKPYIRIQQQDESSMEIRSQKARSIQGGEEITFLKEVIVHQIEGNQKPASTMKTEKIVYHAQQKTASTDLPVLFEQAGDTVQSKGMTAWLQEKRVKLLSQARGRYVPKQNS